MQTYRPTSSGGQLSSDDIRREFQSIRRAAMDANDFLYLKVLHAEPAKVFAGMVVLADGTDWNPGSGEGMYRRNAANSAWAFVG